MTRKRTVKQPAPMMELAHKDPRELTPYPDNSKIHPTTQIKAIADSMAAIGNNRTVIVDENDIVLAGHGTRIAAIFNIENGKVFTRDDGTVESFDTIPVIIRRGLNEQQKRAYVIADNKLAELSIWDDKSLNSELDALEDQGFNLQLVGIDSDLGLDEPDMDSDDLPELEIEVMPPSYRVVVECASEDEQRQVHADLVRQGHECKLVSK